MTKRTDANDSLPRPFGPYQLIRRLAVGGMAEVFVAKAEGHGGFEKLVALKVIHPQISEDEHFIQMLVDEAKLSVLLQHANIAQTFDLGFADGRYFIVMEYVEGLDVWRLSKRLAARGERLPIEACVYIVAEMLAGLEHAHTKCDATGRPLRVVHRDVSPQNVLISYAGEVKLADFGIAKAALRSIDTEVGVIKGKYDYMSPEQAWGDPVDRRTDIFSAGVVLHELLTGRTLYQEDTVPALLDKVRRARIPRPSRLRPEVPAELDAICLHALSRRAEDRFQSAAAFSDALLRLLYALDPAYGAPKLARLVEGIDSLEPEVAAPPPGAAGTSRPTLQTMRRQDFVPAPTSVVHELRAPQQDPEPIVLADVQDDETGVFEGPLPPMSLPTPAPPRSEEAVLPAGGLEAGLHAPEPPLVVPGEDDETSVFARDQRLEALGFSFDEPEPPARGSRLDEDMPTPPRGSRIAKAALRKRARQAWETPPSVELEPSFAREAEALGKRAETGDDRTVVDTTGATARDLKAMLAMASADESQGGRLSSPSVLAEAALRWEPPPRTWEALPFLGPPLPAGGLPPLPRPPAAPRREPARRDGSRSIVAGVVVLAVLAAAAVAVAFST